jgi:hypothetical protein
MNHEQVKDIIIANIDRNNRQKITGKLLQSTLLDMYNDYQPREPGKGLSTNDFTDEDKNQLDNIIEIIEETLHFATQQDIDDLFEKGHASYIEGTAIILGDDYVQGTNLVLVTSNVDNEYIVL